MKKIILIFLIITAGVGLSYVYFNRIQPTVKQQNNITKVMSDIREEYKKINSDVNLIVIEKALTGLSTEGGVLLSYYDKNRNLKKASITFYGEMGKKTIDYFYNNRKLIFCLQKQFYYDQPIYIEGFKINKVEKSKYYFHSENLIQWIDSSKINRDINNEEAKKAAKELISEAYTILNEAYKY